jgi:hypothetical protein
MLSMLRANAFRRKTLETKRFYSDLPAVDCSKSRTADRYRTLLDNKIAIR